MSHFDITTHSRTSAAADSAPDLWQQYAQGNPPPDNGRMEWACYPGSGPGTELLGPVRGCRVIEVGSGFGRNLAHIARRGAASCTGIDASLSMTERAIQLNALLPNLHYVHGDASTHLRQNPAGADLVYSVYGAVDFTDPDVLLPAIRLGLAEMGRLVFATLQFDQHGQPPDIEVRPRTMLVPLGRAGRQGELQRWVLDESVWRRLLDRHGFTVTSSRLIGPPDVQGLTESCLVMTALKVPSR